MTPAERYARCENLILAYEGGATYTNNPKDPGGPTKYGVTLAALAEFRNKPCTPEDVRNLTELEAAEIYRAKYWNAVHGDDMPAGVDLIVFDAAVNTGRSRAAKQLQTALGVAADGNIGSVTIAALSKADPVSLIQTIKAERMDYYKSLPTFATFGHGWKNRLISVSDTATVWAKAE